MAPKDDAHPGGEQQWVRQGFVFAGVPREKGGGIRLRRGVGAPKGRDGGGPVFLGAAQLPSAIGSSDHYSCTLLQVHLVMADKLSRRIARPGGGPGRVSPAWTWVNAAHMQNAADGDFDKSRLGGMHAEHGVITCVVRKNGAGAPGRRAGRQCVDARDDGPQTRLALELPSRDAHTGQLLAPRLGQHVPARPLADAFRWGCVVDGSTQH